MGTALGIGIGIPFTRRSGGAPPFQGLLDLYPNAAAAYSLRKLRAAYSGAAVRIRRSSDNDESDIGFLNNEFDSAAAQTFCGAGNGFVAIWYDQSGNSNNATQTTAANQSRIVDNGVVDTNLSKASLFNNNTNGNMLMNSRTTNLSVFIVRKITSAGVGANNWILGDTDNYDYHVGSVNYLDSGNALANVINGDNYSNGVSKTFTTNAYPVNSTDLISMIHAGNASSNSLFLDRGISGRGLLGNVQEVILYSSNQSANRVGIQNNINSYYGIY
jgi:hypothetical protein